MKSRISTLIEELETGRRACPSLAPIMSHRSLTIAEWGEIGKQAAAALRARSTQSKQCVSEVRMTKTKANPTDTHAQDA